MKNKRIHQSSGVTIIEVLFSIGIIVTGLLGVAGLIMIAGTQMTQGLAADAMSNAGLNAIAEFDSREMRRPDNLLWYNPSTSSFTSVLSNNLYGPGTDSRWGTADNDDDGTDGTDDIGEAGYGDDIPSPSFCIDPFFIAQQIHDNNLISPAVSYFPGISIPADNPDQIVQMLRVTLKNNNPGAPYRMGLLQSREIFLAKDDLSISKPTSATELPQQTWIETQAGDYVKRLNAAEISWMATLTPNRNREDPDNNTTLEPTDQYLMSIVVLNKRYVNYKEDTANVQKERRFDVKFLNGGYGGGEIQLFHLDRTKLDLKHGNWIMLGANSTIGPVFRWYRINFVDDQIKQDSTGPGWYRSMTIQGPDWTRKEWHINGKSHATFIPGVVGVFEKTIRFE